MPAYLTRHLLVFIDGTWVSSSKMEAGQDYSNVYWLNLYLEHHNAKGESQIAFYSPGIGSLQAGWKRIFAGMFAADLPLEVEHAYIDVCSNYMPKGGDGDGDKIYIFGFSRGAVIARIVATLICEYGLLYPSKIQHFPILWAQFIGADNMMPDAQFADFRSKNCFDVDIEFLGLFDTVLGKFSGDDQGALMSIVESNRRLPARIKYCCHVLALDETRNAFAPLLWRDEPDGSRRLEQIWMPGVHSDVGGGYLEDALANVSLHTMLTRLVQNTTLQVDLQYYAQLEDGIRDRLRGDQIKINEEARLPRWAMERLGCYGPRKYDPAGSCQSIHPICKTLAGRVITYKSEKTKKVRDLYVHPGLPDSDDEAFA